MPDKATGPTYKGWSIVDSVSFEFVTGTGTGADKSWEQILMIKRKPARRFVSLIPE